MGEAELLCNSPGIIPPINYNITGKLHHPTTLTPPHIHRNLKRLKYLLPPIPGHTPRRTLITHKAPHTVRRLILLFQEAGELDS